MPAEEDMRNAKVAATDDKNTCILMTYICDINNLQKTKFFVSNFFNIFFVS